MKRLQFHPPGTTFGASEAPGRGASVYDGLKVDFGITPKKKCEIWADPGRSGATLGRPGATLGRPGATLGQPGVIKRLQLHRFGTTFGASGAPGHGESIYDGFGADFVSLIF